MKFRVTGPYQIVHGDKAYVEGDVVEVSESDAAPWLARGYVEKVAEKPAKAEPKAQPKADNKAQEAAPNKAASSRSADKK